MQPSRITVEERNRITDQNAHLFVARHVHDYWPCNLNSNKMMNFITSQLGDDYPYPFSSDHFESAFAYLNEHDFLLQRPIEEPEVDPAVVEEQRKQQQVRDDFDARQAAAKLERDRNMPLSELGKVVSIQNSDLRQQRETSGLPVRRPGLESRPLSNIKMGPQAQARINTSDAHPELAVDSQEWNRHYAAELARLRG